MGYELFLVFFSSLSCSVLLGTELLPPLSYSPSPGGSVDGEKEGGGGTNYGVGYGKDP